MYYSRRIKDIMKQWKDESHVQEIILYNVKREKNDYDDSEYTVAVCTNRPGQLIGVGGTRIDKYRDLISRRLNKTVFLKIIETAEIV